MLQWCNDDDDDVGWSSYKWMGWCLYMWWVDAPVEVCNAMDP